MRTLPILTFHSLDDGGDVISLRPAVFAYGLARLHDCGYHTITLQELTACLRQNQPFPPRSFAITFDDGYASAYEQAFPVLQRLGMSATIFVLVGAETDTAAATRLPAYLDRTMLSWGQIREMHRHGFAFGAHTLTHPDLTRLPPDRVRAEMSGSKALIEDALGAPVTAFAYPYGRYDQPTRDIVRQHFDCACSDRLGLVTQRSDPYALERVDAYYLRTHRLFNLVTTRWFSWYIPARSIPRRLRRAVYWRPG